MKIFAKPDFIEKVRPLIEEMDVLSGAELTVIHLAHCKAEVVAPILQQAFPGGRAAPVRRRPVVRQKGKRPAPRRNLAPTGSTAVRIVAEPITNALLVTAPPKDLEKIQKLVAEMEAEAEKKRPAQVFVTVEYQPANEVAATLNSILGRSGRTAARGAKGAVNRAFATNPTAEELQILAVGERILLKGPQDEVAQAIQLVQGIDVIDQKPISRKVKVLDAEEDEKKLRSMLALRVPSKAVAPKGRKRGKPARATPAVSTGAIQIYADAYENTLLIRAMPRDWPDIDEILSLILSEPDIPMELAGREDLDGPFFVVKLKHKKAWDMSFILEDMINTDDRHKLEFVEGPDDRTLIVRGARSGQKEQVERYVAMWDVPDSKLFRNTLILDSGDKMPPQQLLRLLQKSYRNSTGGTLKITDMGEGGPVQVIDIHAGEEDQDAAPPAEGVSPCVLPLSLLRGLSAVTLGQVAKANAPGDLPDPAVCPVCHQSPCVLPARLSSSLGALLVAQVDDGPAGEAPAAVHNHPAAVSAGEPDDSPAPGAKAEEPQTDGAPAGNDSSEISAMVDPDTGKIILMGPEEELERLQEIIDDVTGGESPTVIRVFPLKYADVNEAAQLLNNVFNQPARVVRQPAGRQPGKGKGAQGQPAGAKGGAPVPAPQPGRGTARTVRGGKQRIKVVPDARTRQLYVVAPLKDIPLVIDVLKKIDTRITIKQDIRMFPLQNLQAEQVVETLREILGISDGGRRAQPRGRRPRRQQNPRQRNQQILQMQGQGRPGQGTLVAADKIRLSAEPQTNTVVAKAPPDTLDLIGDLIEQLEKKTNTTKIEMRRVQLANARATDVASIVKDIAGQMTSGRGGARGPRGRGRSLTSTGVSVNADARTNSVILAGQAVDLERVEKIVLEMDVSDDKGASIRQFAVKGDPTTMAKVLKSLFPSTGKQNDIVISPDASTGTIVVKAPVAQLEEIERQLAEMDSKVAVEQKRRSLKLHFADAETVANDLQAIFADARSRRGGRQAVAIRGNKSNSTLYVTGADDELFAQITELARDMDTAPTGLQVKAFALKHASAIDVDKKLTTMMAKAMATGGLGSFKLDLVGVVPDARTNSLIVTGGPVTFALIDDVLAQIDVVSPTPIARETKSYMLPRTVNANQVAQNIRVLFRGQTFAKTGIEPPAVTANTASNIVMVIANAMQHEQIKSAIIDPIMAAVGEPLQDYQVSLKFARADEVKGVLEEFMNKWRQSRGSKPQDNFTITADPNSNILLLNCAPSTKAVFDKQLEQIDTDVAQVGGVRKPQAYVLKYANPNSVLQAINTAFQRTGRVADRDKVTASLDPNTNSVVVMANQANHERVAEIVEMMDVEGGIGATQDFIYTVKNARAVDLANTLTRQIRATRTPVRGRYPINVVGDDPTNTLIVTATQADYDALLKTIEALDVASGSERLTRTFTLKYAEPWNLPGSIRQQFANRYSKNPNDQVVASYIAGTMTIVVSANPENMAKIEEFIREVDVPSSQEKVTKFIKLNHAQANALANALNQAERSARPRPRNGIYPVSYGSDMSSNTLIVTAPADEFDAIEARIAELDTEDHEDRLRRVFKLVYADPGSVSRMIQNLFRPYGRNPSPKERVSSADDWTTNSVIVSASSEKMAEVEALIAEMDQPGDAQRTEHVIEVTNANPADVANSLQQI
ncbi:MAG: secretin N-terminal domain-containing protein, partial [Phycisphaerae bacterium]